MVDREDKKAQFQQIASRKTWIRNLVIALVAVVTVAGGYLAFAPQSPTGGISPATVDNGVIRIPIQQIDDGSAHYFTYATQQGEVKFFVLKSSDGVYRAAFDACDVCYRAKQGYRQEGDNMVCNNCNMTFASTRISEVKGGCNPAPLQRSIQGDELLIEVKNIEAGAWYFQG